MPSGVGEPLWDICCDAGGEGYAKFGSRKGGMSGGGDGELASELRGEEGTLEGGEERGLEASELASAAIVVSREAAGRRRSGVAAAAGRQSINATAASYSNVRRSMLRVFRGVERAGPGT